MRFIQVITGMIDQGHIITGEVHVEGDIGVMGRVIIHQRYKQADEIHQSQQGKQEQVNRAGKKRCIQKGCFGKVNKEAAV